MEDIVYYRYDSINKIINEIEESIGVKEDDLREFNKIFEIQSSEFNRKTSYYEAIDKCSKIFMDKPDELARLSEVKISLEEGKDYSLKFSYICGVILQSEQNTIEKLIYRSTRGHCMIYFFEFTKEVLEITTGKISTEKRTTFILFYRYDSIIKKLKKILIAHGAELFNIPNLDDLAAITTLLSEVEGDIIESKMILDKSSENIQNLLNALSLNYYD